MRESEAYLLTMGQESKILPGKSTTAKRGPGLGRAGKGMGPVAQVGDYLCHQSSGW